LIYRHLEARYSVRRDELAEKIDVFAKGLEEFLKSGAYIIEMKILEDIHSSYSLIRETEFGRIRSQHDFVDQVKMLM